MATLVTVLLGVGASAQAEPSDEAPLVTAWFATAGADAVRDADAGDPGFVEGLDTARTVTFGEPVPVSTIAVPGYDLAAAAPDGPTDYASTVSPTGSWCARVVLDQVPRDLAVCVTVADDGTVAWESTEQLRFLGDKESLGASALFHQRGTYGITATEVLALDDAAADQIGESAPFDEFVEALARRAAEVRLLGDDVVGGAPALLAAPSDEWDAQVKAALDDRAAGFSWAWLAAGVTGLLAGAAAVAVVRHRHRTA
ncbi:hypothetical protein [Cellulomonas sp.]|uniref:hypothetical protein n=1 Tax=Cellulomonas sp. TaxID=40001 RepID=UPI0025849929|nr:hypothetical protein [Cellulomonas sp.]MCR6688255.1 hypothetical protein [Cellulomonas sp.]